MRYRRGSREVDSLLFDGSAESAAEISSCFAGVAAHGGNLLRVRTAFGVVYVGARVRVVRDRATGVLSTIDDRDFARSYEPLAA